MTNVGRSITVGDRVIDNGFDTDICALRGDSGGPVVTGTQALGISSASNLAAVATCDATAVQQATGGMGPMLSATPINSILGANRGWRSAPRNSERTREGVRFLRIVRRKRTPSSCSVPAYRSVPDQPAAGAGVFIVWYTCQPL